MATDIMSFQYMPLYTGDYLRDTRHLSCSEHGIFLNFLMHCWDQKGPLPSDERKQAGICNARSGDEIEAMRRVLDEFFIWMDDGLYNKRMSEEITKAEMVSVNNSKAGMLSAAIRARTKARRESSTPVQHPFNDCSTPVGIPTPTPILLKPKVKDTVGKKTPDITHSFETEKKVLDFLNEKTGRAYRPVAVNLEFIRSRLKEGYTEDECRMVIAKKAREWLGDDAMAVYLRPATLFNRTKFNQYIGECVVQSAD